MKGRIREFWKDIYTKIGIISIKWTDLGKQLYGLNIESKGIKQKLLYNDNETTQSNMLANTSTILQIS